jgi:transporter family protein
MYYINMSWIVFALLSAIFAALTSILAKIGIKDIDSNLATAIRTVIIFIFTWGIVFVQGTYKNIGLISKSSLLFLVLSGLATGLSWLFYFKALQSGEASKVVPIDKLSLVFTVLLAALVLHEKLTIKMFLGVIMMVAGAIIVAF